MISCCYVTLRTQDVISAEMGYDSAIEGRVGLVAGQKLNPIFVLNNLIINDTIKIEKLRKKYKSSKKLDI